MKKISALTFLFSIVAIATVAHLACYTAPPQPTSAPHGAAWSSTELTARASLAR